MNSTVRIDLEGVALKTSLRLCLDHDPHHVPSLALRGVVRMPSHRLVNVALAESAQSEHDRREWIAQLVRQDRYQPMLESVPGLPKLGVEAGFRASLSRRAVSNPVAARINPPAHRR
jgi:hypothetical protein